MQCRNHIQNRNPETALNTLQEMAGFDEALEKLTFKRFFLETEVINF